MAHVSFLDAMRVYACQPSILVGMPVLCGKVLSLACKSYKAYTDTCQPTSTASLQAASAALDLESGMSLLPWCLGDGECYDILPLFSGDGDDNHVLWGWDQ